VSSERNAGETPQPDEPAEAGQDVLTITDPKMMRAMAHPLRLAILELFAVHETLTATQVSEALGESPANCAFHLRTLGKYGVIEEAGGGRGRERPWREVSGTIRINTNDLKNNKQAELAAVALGQVTLDRWLSRIRSAFMDANTPADWEDARNAHESVVFLTLAETHAISEEIRLLFRPYLSRRKDPALRPPGVLPVEFDLFAFVRRDLAALVADVGETDVGEADADETGPAQKS
jgi:DNA-binding transcriptional ArsR family regulator